MTAAKEGLVPGVGDVPAAPSLSVESLKVAQLEKGKRYLLVIKMDTSHAPDGYLTADTLQAIKESVDTYLAEVFPDVSIHTLITTEGVDVSVIEAE